MNENLKNDLAEKLKNRGYRLELKSDSDLKHLITINKANVTQTHNDVIEDISDKISREFNFYKNNLMPLARSIANKANSAIVQYRESHSKYTKNIYLFEVPEVFIELNAQESFLNVVDLPIIPSDIYNSMSSLDLNPDRLRSMCSSYSSIAEIKAMFNDYLDTIEPEQFVNAYEKYFKNIHKLDHNDIFLSQTYPDHNDKHDLYLAYLYANYFINNKPEKANVKTGDWKVVFAQIKNRIGGFIKKRIETYKRYEASEMLLLEVNNDNIFLTKSVYDKFINKGGEIDVILGASKTREKRLKLNDIMGKKDMYKHAYIELNKQQKIISEKEIANTLRLTYINIVTDLYKNDFSDVMKYSMSENCKNNFGNRLESFIYSMPNVKLFNTDTFSLMIMTNVFFPESNADIFFKLVNVYQKNNPDFTVQDCAKYAALEMVTTHILTQVDVVKDV